MFHTHGLIVGLHCALAASATVRLHPRFDATTIVDELSSKAHDSLRPTLFFGPIGSAFRADSFGAGLRYYF